MRIAGRPVIKKPRAPAFEPIDHVRIQSDGPSRMVKRPTGSGGEPSSPNCESSAGVKARHLSSLSTSISSSPNSGTAPHLPGFDGLAALASRLLMLHRPVRRQDRQDSGLRQPQLTQVLGSRLQDIRPTRDVRRRSHRHGINHDVKTATRPSNSHPRSHAVCGNAGLVAAPST